MNGPQMDHYLCKILYNLSSVFKDFPCEDLQGETEDVLYVIQNKCLNVAVIGPSNGGKSSLINALLGMPVLPVGAELTTGAISRVTYGLKPGAVVYFKDGTDAEVAISELENYVSRQAPDSGKVASTVEEAEIRYPTQLCVGGIDIIDTPGLNDTENMTAVGERLGDNVHVAIVAINATKAYSELECQWVTELLTLPALNHIVFVLTCMDLVGEEDAPKVLADARRCICEKTLENARLRYQEFPDFLAKAEQMFSEDALPIYPVSAAMALKSYENGDYELLNRSNIPTLRQELMTTMNVCQQMAGVHATEQVLERFTRWIAEVPADLHTSHLRLEARRLAGADGAVNAYFAERKELTEAAVQAMEADLKEQLDSCLSVENLDNAMRELCEKYICVPTVNTKEEMTLAIGRAEGEVTENILRPMADRVQKVINATVIRSGNGFFATRDSKLCYAQYEDVIKEAQIPTSEFIKEQLVKGLQDGMQVNLPEFLMSAPVFMMKQKMLQSSVESNVSKFTKKYRKAWQTVLPMYTQKWSELLQKAERDEMSIRLRNVICGRMGALKEKIAFSEARYQQAKQVILEENERFRQFRQSLWE